MRFGLLVEAWIIVFSLGYQELLRHIPPWRVHEGVTPVAGHMLPAGGVAFILKPVFEGRGITVGVGFHRRPHTSVSVPISVFPFGFVAEKGGNVFRATLQIPGLVRVLRVDVIEQSFQFGDDALLLIPRALGAKAGKCSLVDHHPHAQRASGVETPGEIIRDGIAIGQIVSLLRIAVTVPVEQDAVPAGSQHSIDLPGDLGRIVLIVAHDDVTIACGHNPVWSGDGFRLALPEPRLHVPNDFCGRACVEQGVDIGEICIAGSGNGNRSLCSNVGRIGLQTRKTGAGTGVIGGLLSATRGAFVHHRLRESNRGQKQNEK